MSTIPTYQKINAFMESAKPSVYTGGNAEGVERVRKEDGMYAYFMEAAAIEYNVERKCDLRQLGGLLDSKGYGIALPKGGDYLLKYLMIFHDFHLVRFSIHGSHISWSSGTSGIWDFEGIENQMVGKRKRWRFLQGKMKCNM